MKRIRNIGVTGLLAVSLILVACKVPGWVTSVENDVNIALPIVASIVTLVDPALAPIVNEITQALNALESVLNTYKASPTATNLQAVQSAVAAVNANIAQLEGAAQIHNPNTDAKITAIVGLLSQLSAAIVSMVPQPAGTAKVSLPKVVHDAAYFKAEYNRIVDGDPRFHQLQ